MTRENASRLLAMALILLGTAQAQATVSDGTVPSQNPRQQISRTESSPQTFEGLVLTPDGMPAAEAVVVCSAGGKAVTAEDGFFRLETRVPNNASSVSITAMGGPSGSLRASAQVSFSSALGAVSMGTLQLAAAGPCDASWLPTFGGQPATDKTVSCMTVFDDGSGPALYVGGQFGSAGATMAHGVAKWDGTDWAPLGDGLWTMYNTLGGTLPTRVESLAVFDDGTGPALYAGGFFYQSNGVVVLNMAKWDGTNWAAVGGGIEGAVFALTAFDDGTGPALFAGGWFTMAGTVAVDNIAKWDGSNWMPVGTGMDGPVRDLLVLDLGTGPALYAGGSFGLSSGTPPAAVARWDGSTWLPVGSGMDDSVRSLAGFDDGSGIALYAAGSFTTAGGAPASRVAKWDGSSWGPLGAGLPHTVLSLAVYDDATGAKLYAGVMGSGGSIGGNNYIGQWDGSSWVQIGANLGYVNALQAFDDGNGPALYAGRSRALGYTTLAVSVTKWNGSSWSNLQEGIDREVRGLAVFDDGEGEALYVGGRFANTPGGPSNQIEKWDGTRWSSLGLGLGGGGGGGAHALAVFDAGQGEELYVGGQFATAGGSNAASIAKWDGSGWSPLGIGLSYGPGVRDLAVFNDGVRPALFVAGIFSSAGGRPVGGIAKWDGSDWSALGAATDPTVYLYALTVFDDGAGDKLYVGGTFTSTGGVATNNIATWDGLNWAALGGGVDGSVWALAEYDDGSGSALYVGGSFENAGGVPAMNIARWDGASWSALGTGAVGVGGSYVYSMAVHDGVLYVSGVFDQAGGASVNNFAAWDGSAWSAVGAGLSFTAAAMQTWNDGTGEALFVGGYFDAAFDSGDSFLTKLGTPALCGNGTAYCFGDGSGATCPCGAFGNAAEGCLNSGNVGGAELSSAGYASLTNDTFELQVHGVNGVKPGLILRGDSQLNNGLGTPFGDGLLCVGGQTARSQIQVTSSGSTTFTTFQGNPFGTSSYGPGVPTNYQFWYRDPNSTCGGGFNFSNAWSVIWMP